MPLAASALVPPAGPLRRALRVAAGLVLGLLLGQLMAACGSLPPRQPTAVSHAYADTQATMLARVARASLASAPDAAASAARAAASATDAPKQGARDGLSGFRLLPSGEHSFDARLALAERAERSIDAQYYHLHNDTAGASFLRALRDAAARGVRVRLLVDDYHASESYALLCGLAAHENVEVRLFNPLLARWGSPLERMLLSLRDFARVNHRMHNKLFVADNQVAIYGGRNIADEYFYRHAQANFVDLDVISVGAVAPELSASFDRYWNSEQVWRLEQFFPRPPEGPARQAQRADFETDSATIARELAPLNLVPTDPLGQTGVRRQLAEGRLQMVPGSARVHDDPPEKAALRVNPQAPTRAMQGKLEVLAAAREEVVIVNPYFVPGPVGMPMIEAASRKGVRTVVVTNSIDATDEPLVHRAYAKYRESMLRLGVKLYEFAPELARRSGAFGPFEKVLARLHAKVAVVDRRSVLVGSVNLDARSALLNTELGVTIESEVLARQLQALLTQDGFASMYEVRPAPAGEGLRWLGRDAGGASIEHDSEPGASRWLEFKLWLQSLFIGEEAL